MCGIVGIAVYRDNCRIDRKTLEAMRDSMFHRGPDGSGLWINSDKSVGFGHRRLAIIDLDNNAAQPMSNSAGSVQVTFNGEIYNHLALREDLERCGYPFKTDHSDTEVLVHGYEEWGLRGLLDRIIGDYAFGIWDDRKGKCLVARDRMGVKPVYFGCAGGAFMFASEIKALMANPVWEREIEPVAMYHYLSFWTTPAPLTMFKGVYKLPAGHWLEFRKNGSLKIERYWDATPGKGIPQDDVNNLSDEALEEYYVSGIRSRLRQSVERRMMSDVAFGAFLSGGVDSSTNVALMGEFSSKPIDTFAVGFKDHTLLNELGQARMISKQFGTNHHEILINETDMTGYISELVHTQDEPIADWVCIPLNFLSKLTSNNGVTVVQVGEGADEQFCGYSGYMKYLRLYYRYWAPYRRIVPEEARRWLAGGAKLAAWLYPKWDMYADIMDRAARGREHFWGGVTVFWETMKSRLVNFQALEEASVPHDGVSGDVVEESLLAADTYNVVRWHLDYFDKEWPQADILTRMTYLEFKLRLPELLLMRVDKITMSKSIEARVPFLDNELVEFSMDIPEAWKVKNGEPKYLLKRAVEGLIPNDVIYRKKMGFGAPMSEWLRGEFGRCVEDTLLKSRLLERGYLEAAHIKRLLQEHRNGKRQHASQIWALFNLVAWYDYWVDSAGRR